MRKPKLAIAGVSAGLVLALGAVAGVAVASGSGPGSVLGGDSDTPITGAAYQKAVDAALAHTGGGTATETEVGDEESLYEVEVRLPDGSSVDVQLDGNFGVVGSQADTDSPGDRDGS